MMRAAAYGRSTGTPSQADLERVFFVDDDDRALVDLRRGEHMRAGFALQLVTARWLGTFLEDPVEVPGAVLDFVAGQLRISDPSQVKRCSGTPNGRRRGSIPSGRSAFAHVGALGCLAVEALGCLVARHLGQVSRWPVNG